MNEQIKEQISKAEEAIGKLKSGDFKIVFYTLDTKGNPLASIANIYEQVLILTELGYNAMVLHDKNDYSRYTTDNNQGVEGWLGKQYADLKHVSIESQELTITPQDIIVVPESLSSLMDQLKGINCKKVVLCQSHEYIFDVLPFDKRWQDYGFNEVIATSQRQSVYISNHFVGIKTHVVPPSIPSYFTKPSKPKKPIIAIHTRNHGDTMKIVKSFYMLYPVYKFVTFRDMRNLPREDFANQLSEACLSVWVDDIAGFGTFPVESMECGTPVIGKIPNMIPEWMEDKTENGVIYVKSNGVWTNTTINIPELIATYLKMYLENATPKELLDEMDKSCGKYTRVKQAESVKEVFGGIVENRIHEINKIIETLNIQSNNG